MRLKHLIKNQTLSKMFEDNEGKISSTRVMAYQLQVFANWIVGIFLLLVIALAVVVSFVNINISEDSMSLLMMARNTTLIVIVTLYSFGHIPKAIVKKFEEGGSSSVIGELLNKVFPKTETDGTGTSGTSGQDGTSDGNG